MATAHKLHSDLQRRFTILAICGAGLFLHHGVGVAADIPAANRTAIDKAVGFLRTQLTKNRIGAGNGEFVLAAYAVIKGKESMNAPYDVNKDPFVMSVVQAVLKNIDAKGQYRGSGIYNAGVQMMLLEAAAIPKGKYKTELQTITDYVVKNQDKKGFWNYLGGDKHGDTSVTQFGALGLWAAARAGIKVPLETWDRMAGWLIRSQTAKSGWKYRPASASSEGETLSMTVAGTTSLFVSARHLYPEKFKQNEKKRAVEKRKKKAAKVNFVARNTFEMIRRSAKRGFAWSNSAAKKGIVVGVWSMYTAYGIERLAAMAKIKTLGGRDWYATGSTTLLKTQAKDGSWNGKAGKIPSTAFGILFLSKSTEAIVGGGGDVRPAGPSPRS